MNLCLRVLCYIISCVCIAKFTAAQPRPSEWYSTESPTCGAFLGKTLTEEECDLVDRIVRDGNDTDARDAFLSAYTGGPQEALDSLFIMAAGFHERVALQTPTLQPTREAQQRALWAL